MKLRIITKKYAVVSALQFPAKSILRPMVFTKTTRQRGGEIQEHWSNRVLLNLYLGANVEPIRADGAFKEFHDNRGLFALCNGTVRYTQEIFVPVEGTLDVSKKTKKFSQ